MAMNIETEGGVNRVTVDGELTIYEVSGYHDVLKEGFQADKNMVVDLSSVEEVDASGLQLLAAYGKKAISNGAEISFVNMNDVAREALQTSRLLTSLNCEDQES